MRLQVTEDEVEDYPNKPAAEEAEEKGLEIIVADDEHLQLDLDEQRTSANLKALEILARHGLVDPDDFIRINTRSRGHNHLYIRLPRPQPLEVRIAMQAALGSDPKREMLGLIRKLKPEMRLNHQKAGQELVLFETVRAAEMVRRWLDERVPF